MKRWSGLYLQHSLTKGVVHGSIERCELSEKQDARKLLDDAIANGILEGNSGLSAHSLCNLYCRAPSQACQGTLCLEGRRPRGFFLLVRRETLNRFE
jgi:hypothetical protein